ncbi:MAG: triose-phosphate isomerase [Bacteroidota bacterium]
MRRKIVAGNWKMNTNPEEGLKLAAAVMDNLPDTEAVVILIPPFTHLTAIAEKVKASGIFTGAQNCAEYEKGAYTGEVSAAMVKAAGAGYVLIGHSERRSVYGETDQSLKAKTNLALAEGLVPVFCCGESLDERNAGNHFRVVEKQLVNAIFHLDPDNFRKTVIAYEPVWAIGTGINATAAQAQEMHYYIRELIVKKYSEIEAQDISIIYGGSCKPSNSDELFSQPDVDGGLIGGASLIAEDFIAIIKSMPK